MQHSPLFSVIIPTHNAEEYIAKGLSSICAQTFTDYELIVVCDACDDGTEDLARRFGATTINVNNHLDGLTRNAGLNIASGKYVLFMDDDDWFLHEFAFEQLAGMVGKNDEDAILFSFVDHNKYYRQLPDDIAVPVWCKCWRRKFIGDTRFSSRPYWSDCDFHNKLMRKPHKFLYWDMPLYFYNYMREGSVSQKFFSDELPAQKYKSRPAFVQMKETWDPKTVWDSKTIQT